MKLLTCGAFTLDLTVPKVMAIINVTPDSFSEGAAAKGPTDRALRAIEEGADLLDLGAESTRPGALPISDEEEWARLEPVLRGLRDVAVPLSIDTYHPRTMRRALDLGASMINDVRALQEPDALMAVRNSGCAVCLMHMQGTPPTMQQQPVYADVTHEVLAFLRERLTACESAGIDRARLLVDPGFGFGKRMEHNLALQRNLSRFSELGAPLLVGWSRKGTLGALTGRDVHERVPAGLAAAVIALDRGASIIRTHDVGPTVDAVKVWTAVMSVSEAP